MARSTDATSDTVPSSAEILSGRSVQLRGSRWAAAVLRTLGWRIEFDGLPERQGVLILYPHTSNWDFVFAMLARSAIGMPAKVWGKDSLFRVPLLGAWMRWLGVVPVLRNSPRGMVGEMVAHMTEARERDEFYWLALAPEGTRSQATGWRSGFYQVALHANVPLALAYIDYANRILGVCAHIRLGGDVDADLALIAEHLKAHHGKCPELASPIRLNK
ncbi:MAG: 1-acyl-sn-glycerol-3-phosphate acyltransferase [Ideonella sp.]|jgi:1-acyl-sn-glycerol-3-phosphate acyltransferase|nr:1-acyl-sn-glycerol-3-phosphate acyltransferase [Ideonella sp.]